MRSRSRMSDNPKDRGARKCSIKMLCRQQFNFYEGVKGLDRGDCRNKVPMSAKPTPPTGLCKKLCTLFIEACRGLKIRQGPHRGNQRIRGISTRLEVANPSESETS